MTRTQQTLRGLLLLAAATTLTACNKDSADVPDSMVVTANEVANIDVTDKVLQPNTDVNPLAAVASDIPYPMYPNGTKYRVGGENGLKIVVFQTEDPFHKVDEYYNGLSDNAGMARVMAMSDYVRYTNGTGDVDPWATHLPGIVIHEFDGESAREAVGASSVAQTNIIMSF